MWRLRLVLVNSCDCIICLDKYQEPGLDHLAPGRLAAGS